MFELLVPPIFSRVWRYARRRGWIGLGKKEHFEMLSLESAKLAVPVSRSGWNAESVISAEKSRWEQFCRNLEKGAPLGFSHEYQDLSVVESPWFHNVHMTFAYGLALSAVGRERLRVLDYGGGLGHYYRLARALLPDFPIEYHIKEVPYMMEAGRQLNPDVHWHLDDACLELKYDFVLVNGSLQYIPPEARGLDQICKAAAHYFLLTRVPTVEHSATFPAIQREHGAEMVHWQFRRQEVVDSVSNAGLRLVRELVVGDHCWIPGAPEEFVLRGWLFKR